MVKTRDGFVSNSSTTSFIIRTKWSIEKSKEKLEKTISCYNEVFETNLKFDDVVKIYLASRGKVFDLIYEEEVGVNFNDEDNEEVEKHTDLFIDSFPIYQGNFYLVIESVEENSIPDELLFWIEKLFHAYETKH